MIKNYCDICKQEINKKVVKKLTVFLLELFLFPILQTYDYNMSEQVICHDCIKDFRKLFKKWKKSREVREK